MKNKTLLKVYINGDELCVKEKEGIGGHRANVIAGLSEYIIQAILRWQPSPEKALCALDELYFSQMDKMCDKLSNTKSNALHEETVEILRNIKDSIEKEMNCDG